MADENAGTEVGSQPVATQDGVHGGPFKKVLGKALRKRLKDKLIQDGASPEDAEATLVEAESDYPLLDWFLQYGIQYIFDLLKGLFLSQKPTP